MYNKTIFSAILGLSSNWRITNVRPTEQDSNFEIQVCTSAGAAFSCPVCGGVAEVISEEERSWQHNGLFCLRVCITALLPQVRCEVCGDNQVRAPWEKTCSRVVTASGPAAGESVPAVIPASERTE
jgi:hypothetical protein